MSSSPLVTCCARVDRQQGRGGEFDWDDMPGMVYESEEEADSDDSDSDDDEGLLHQDEDVDLQDEVENTLSEDEDMQTEMVGPKTPQASK